MWFCFDFVSKFFLHNIDAKVPILNFWITKMSDLTSLKDQLQALRSDPNEDSLGSRLMPLVEEIK